MLFPISNYLITVLVIHASVVMAEEYPKLGTPSLERYGFKYDFVVDEQCNYKLEAKFSHDPANPLGDAERCQPGELDENGVPYLNGRYSWQSFEPYVKASIGIDHLSIDFNPCGHPGPGFLTPHYDFHYYLVSPEFRMKEMTCDLIPGTPVCDPSFQSSANGEGFFVLPISPSTNDTTLASMPSDYGYLVNDAVVNMGMHVLNVLKEPVTPADWTEPSLLFLSYNGKIIAVEPMLPGPFVFGEESRYYEEHLEYNDQHVDSLPRFVSVDYDGDSMAATIIMEGKSDLCGEEFEKAKTGEMGDNVDLSSLGVNDLSPYEATYTMIIDDLCQYEFSVSFQHDASNIVHDESICTPYMDSKFNWVQLDEDTKKATGLDHISIDWHPCGFPDFGFTAPHYDVSMFFVTPDYRATRMTCDTVPDTMLCQGPSNQTSGNGKGFFVVGGNAEHGTTLANIPYGYNFLADDAVIHSGLHVLDLEKGPKSAEEWTDPVFGMKSHSGQVVAIEPKLPMPFFYGLKSQKFATGLAYQLQSLHTLPEFLAVDYNGDLGLVTVILGGRSNTCIETDEQGTESDTSGSTTLHYHVAVVLFVIATLGRFY